MRYLPVFILPLTLFLAACPPPESIMTDEELAEAAQQGSKLAAKEIHNRAVAADMPALPDSPESEAAFREVLAAGDEEMMLRLNHLGNPWARWYEARDILTFNTENKEEDTRARLFMQSAAERDVLEARAFLIHAHQNGLYGYPKDQAYVDENLLPLRLDLSEEIELGRDDYIEVLKELPDAKQP